jgi:lambda family phage portal protein
MVETLANDVIGTGPRLQIQTDDEDLNTAIEAAFAQWCRATDCAEKLRTMKKAKVQDGEGFAVLITNKGLASPVKMDLRLVEADQVRFVDISLLLVPSVDGIQFDDWGNPVNYHVLRAHPGGLAFGASFAGLAGDYDVIPARNVLHWFRADRPGQHRGLPEILAALPLYAQLRRYTLAVLDAAEAAADHAIVAKTQAGANVEVNVGEPFDVLPLERRMMTFLPEGYDIGQIKPEQPSTTYDAFTRAILCEIARCLNMPYNIAAGNSSGYNYASGRLDHQTYFKSIRVERSHCEIKVLDPVFRAWFDEAVLVSNYLPLKARSLRDVRHQWHWDGHEHVDPAKEALADQTRLASGTTTYADIFARAGKDHVNAMTAQAAALGLTLEQYRAKLAAKLLSVGAPVPEATDNAEERETVHPYPPDNPPSADDTENL